MGYSIDEILFIINPNSGNRNYKFLIDKLLKFNSKINYFISHSLEEFDNFFKNMNPQFKVVIICGGDGTINNSLTYFERNQSIILGVIPMGSGNGFARELGFHIHINHFLNKLETAETQEVDLIQINNQFSCNLVGIGIDSYVAKLFENSKKRGFLSYIFYSLKAILCYKPISSKIYLKSRIIEGKFLAICIANTRQFGNNAIIAPNAKFNDGILDLVLIKSMPWYKLIVFIYKMFSGGLKPNKYIEFVKDTNLIIESESETYHIDGEAREMSENLNISLKKTIKVLKLQ